MTKLSDHIEGMDYVQKCMCCGGNGEYEQIYTVGCGGGTYRASGRCDWCGGRGITLVNSREKVPASVIAQIRTRAQETANAQ